MRLKGNSVKTVNHVWSYSSTTVQFSVLDTGIIIIIIIIIIYLYFISYRRRILTNVTKNVKNRLIDST